MAQMCGREVEAPPDGGGKIQGKNYYRLDEFVCRVDLVAVHHAREECAPSLKPMCVIGELVERISNFPRKFVRHIGICHPTHV
jgi:hypothetical protein